MRYGERTARGTAAGKRICWDRTFWGKRSERSSGKMMERNDVTENIAFSDCNGHTVSTGKKNDSDAVDYSQSGVGQFQGSGKGCPSATVRQSVPR